MTPRPYQLLTASRLAAVHTACGQALQAWCTEWRPLAPVAGGLTVCARHAPEDADTSSGLLAGDPHGAYIWVPATSLELLASWLFNTDGPLPAQGIASEVAHEALRHLLNAWLGTTDTTPALLPAALPDSAGQPGMPIADITLALGSHALRATARLNDAAPADATTANLPAPGALKPALARQLVTLSADLGDVEIDLRTLDKLAAGDVIRFDTALDQPLRLRVDGRALESGARAHPGMLNGHRALEIVIHRKTP
jgi:flagellar motor switch/type III secretory pathway protein FliN